MLKNLKALLLMVAIVFVGVGVWQSVWYGTQKLAKPSDDCPIETYKVYTPANPSFEEEINFSDIIGVNLKQYEKYGDLGPHYIDLVRGFHTAWIDYYVRGEDKIWRHTKVELKPRPHKFLGITLGLCLMSSNPTWDDVTTYGNGQISVKTQYEPTFAEDLGGILVVLTLCVYAVVIAHWIEN